MSKVSRVQTRVLNQKKENLPGFEKKLKKENIFVKGKALYGDNFDKALEIVDNFIDVDYPKVKGTTHVDVPKPLRAVHAIKICEFIDETGVDMDHIPYMFRSELHGANSNPLIMYVTTPNVLGYWTLNLKCDLHP